MKPDYQLFKKLKFGESGLGWNENTKTIEASPIWWLQKTQENPKYAKFSDKDLSLYMQYYDTLFQRPPNLFPAPSLKSSKSSGTKIKKSGAEFVRAGLDSLAAAMSYMSTQSTIATDDATLNVAVDILDNMEQVPSGSELYFYAKRYLLEKGNMTLFLKARSNELRYDEIMYNFTRRAGGNQNDN
ncbi:hypothetical protein POM88_051799 [Heracleum sosnowskyi]|uniref:Myb/SANT-like domain-containing protein n=1 Tax=Heracleum sosnowskyi TaxID=360622 RepID=A0AAD8H2J9_9APIA|nr:hypothetical protein POM88_051799 [Heracleum sosnowskyi]